MTHKKHISTLRGHNAEFLNAKHGGTQSYHLVLTGGKTLYNFYFPAKSIKAIK